MTGSWIMRPSSMKVTAKMAMASRKFATGPASTMAARFHTGLSTKLRSRSAAVMVVTASKSGTLAPLASPSNLT